MTNTRAPAYYIFIKRSFYFIFKKKVCLKQMPSIQKLGQLHLCKSRQSAEYEYPSRYRVYILSNSQAVDQILFSFKAYGSNLI